jgi:selT/selW/selH-like putative selenoprotein
MVRNFRALAEFLETRYPELRGQVHGSNYPPPQHAIYAAQAAGLLQWAALGMYVGGPTLFAQMGIAPHPEWYTWMTENKMATFMGVFFANSAAQSMSATGAFEVEVDGVMVYSKLESGRMPTARDLVEGFEKVGLFAMEARLE